MQRDGNPLLRWQAGNVIVKPTLGTASLPKQRA
jgi:hypothetical protein